MGSELRVPYKIRKEINALAIAKWKKEHPTNPYPLTPKLSVKNSNELTKTIIKYVMLKGGFAERISPEGRVRIEENKWTDVVGFEHRIKSVTRIPSAMTPGTADIAIAYKGLNIKVEVKVGKDRQSEAQQRYQARVERAGGIYYIAKTFDNFYEWFNNL